MNSNSEQMISIITPTFNRGAFIQDAVQTVIDQTFSNWELLIVDDESTDGTKTVIASQLTDTRIKYFFQDN